MKKLFLLSTLIAFSVPALADFNCNGSIKNRTIDDNVKVHKQCVLDHVTIKGNLMLHSNSHTAIKNSTIDGNLESKGNFSQVNAHANRIDGNIQLEDGRNIQLTSNRVNGNIQLKDNSGSIVVKNNCVNGNLECEDNRVKPTGGTNRVSGDKEDQCRHL